ncbi:MAG: hypothetical protein WEE67_06715 [Chloroflexota bacterium]
MSRRIFFWLLDERPAPNGSTALVEELLSRYAAKRLGATPRQLDELRAVTMQVYQTRVDQDLPRVRPRRLAYAVALAAVLALAGTVGAAESGPGEPLYGLRLAIQSLTLPEQGAARADAVLALLEQRLAEAREENVRHNESGVADAVRAYQVTLADLHWDVSGPYDAALAEGLRRHVATLQDILGDAPSPTQVTVQQALEQAQKAQQAVQDRSTQPPSPFPPPGTPFPPPGRP